MITQNEISASDQGVNDFDTEEQTDLDNEIIDLKEPFDPKKSIFRCNRPPWTT